jgi:hypothetical protein
MVQALASLYSFVLLVGCAALLTPVTSLAHDAVANNGRSDLSAQRCASLGLRIIPAADLQRAQRSRFGVGVADCRELPVTRHEHPAMPRAYANCVLGQRVVDPVLAAELYANGWGVGQDRQLAMSLICRADGIASAEREQMLAALVHRKTGAKSAPFRYCSYVTSGAGEAGCAYGKARRAQAQRERRLAAAVAGWSVERKRAWLQLLAATAAWANARGQYETDPTGSSAAARAVEAREAVWQELTEAIVAAARGDWPDGRDPKAARALLATTDATLRTQMQTDPAWFEPYNVLDAQLAWQSYREAWLRLAALLLPPVAVDRVDAWLCRSRAQQLRGLLPPD